MEQKIAHWLRNHDSKVKKVYWPGFDRLAPTIMKLQKRQMRGFGGMISFELS